VEAMTDKKRRQRIMPPAIKPGTRSAYLWELPDEEIDRMLREHDVDTEELNRILAGGGEIITFNHIKHRRSEQCLTKPIHRNY